MISQSRGTANLIVNEKIRLVGQNVLDHIIFDRIEVLG
jgi:hypothetical protein